jgi:hypothetical protein
MHLDQVHQNIKNLDWSMPKEIQELAVKNLLGISDQHTPLLIQDYGKYSWENAVIVLKEIGFPRNRYALPRLIWLLQDITWPGALMGIDIMRTIDNKEVLIPLIEVALESASSENDYMWIAGIKRLIEDIGITDRDFNNKEVFHLLTLADEEG